MRARGHDDGAAGDFKARAALGSPRGICWVVRPGMFVGWVIPRGKRQVELADVALDARDFGFEVGLDLGMFLDLINEAAGEGGDVVVLEGVMNVVQGAAQTAGLLDQMDAESLVGERERGGHAAQAAADDDAGLVHRERAALERPERAGAGDGHFDEFNRLLGGGFRRGRMHPGTLVADVGHVEEVRVQPGLAQRFAEQRLVRARRAGRHHDAVEPVLMNHFLDVRQARVRTGEHGVRRQHHVALVLDALDDRLDVHDRPDVHAAMADEHAQARFLVGDVVLGGISLFGDERIAGRREQFHGHGRRGAGLGDGFGNVLGFLRRAADEHAGPGGGQRQEPVGVAETVFVELDVQAGGQSGHAVRRFHAHG